MYHFNRDLCDLFSFIGYYSLVQLLEFLTHQASLLALLVAWRKLQNINKDCKRFSRLVAFIITGSEPWGTPLNLEASYTFLAPNMGPVEGSD